MTSDRTAVYPRQTVCIAYAGSFDPFTFGHLDLIARSVDLCDELDVVVMDNAKKRQVADATQRAEWVRRCTVDRPNVRVFVYSGMLTQFCAEHGIKYCLRGLRHGGEWFSEYQMAAFNRELNDGIETIFLPTSPRFQHLSSSAVRELLYYGQDISRYVPAPILRDVERLYRDDRFKIK